MVATEPLNDPSLKQEIALLSDVMLAAAASGGGHLSDEQVDAALGVATTNQPLDEERCAQGDQEAQR